MKKLNESVILEKKSKFIGILYEIDSLEDIELILNGLKKEHKKAKHICYAYSFQGFEKKSDDKEPSGTAGSPILDIIHYNNLDHHLIVVIRYFGGVLLGRGLLTRSYSKAASLVISSTYNKK